MSSPTGDDHTLTDAEWEHIVEETWKGGSDAGKAAVEAILTARAGKDAAAVAAVRALGMNWARLSAMAMDDEVREWTSAASRSVLAALDVVDHPPCCGPTCQGTACWDCKGTGHPHDVAPALDVAPPTTDLDAVRRKDDWPRLDPRVCTDPACTIPRKPGRPMHGPHDFRAGPRADAVAQPDGGGS